MDKKKKAAIAASIQNFRLPRYQELPDVGLYLEQTTRYISEYLTPLQEHAITSSMISNYVKKELIANPVKKQYNKEQISHLFFIAIIKSVVSIDDLHTLIELQKSTYPSQIAYDYFCSEFENILFFVFGLKDSIESIGTEESDEKMILRNAIITAVHKIYLEKYLAYLHDAKSK
ncbi:MAG: DUF1836 domain-containing protein [Lachnospiraceae bacterium]|nr:DUF1836 domain-containing protein [Lachnospiraceae bacterium]